MKLVNFRSEFLKSLFTLVSGTALAQLIPFLLYPIITRLFLPEELGLYALYASIIAAVVVVVNGRFENALMLPALEDEAVNVFQLATRIRNRIVWISSILLLLLFSYLYFILHREDVVVYWLPAASIFLFFLGYIQAYNSWLTRKKQYKSISEGRIIQSLGINVCLIILGYLGLSYHGVFAANLLGITASFLFFYLLKSARINVMKPLTRIERKGLVRKYIQFPLINGPQALIDMFQMNGIIYLISFFFSTSITGLYAFSYRILMLPMGFIGSSLAQIFYQRAAVQFQQDVDIKPLMFKTLRISILFSIPVLFVLSFWGSQLFTFVFGAEWCDAGLYSAILSPWFMLDFIRAPLSQVPMITGRLSSYFRMSLLGSFLLILSFIIPSVLTNNVILSLSILSGVMSVYTVFIIFWLFHFGSRSKRTVEELKK